MNPTNASSAPTASARDVRDTRDADNARPADRERFDDALQRASQRRGGAPHDEDDAAAQPAEAGLPVPFAYPMQADAAAATSAMLAVGHGAAPVRAQVMSAEQLGASLSQLQAPLDSTQGVQQWQFALAERSLPLASVQLQAAVGGAWQMSLQPHGGRDRQVLQAQLDKLRERLRARGAPVSDVRLGDDGDALF